MKPHQIIILLVLLIAIALFFLLGLNQYLNLDYLKTQQTYLMQYYHTYPFWVMAGFFMLYIAVTGLSLPGAIPLSLLAGMLFGLLWGTLIVSFAATLGATLAFLMARFVLRDTLQQRFNPALEKINQGIARNGGFYLFTLRLVPLFPFSLINLLMGLTQMRVWTYMWVSQVGMLPGAIVYINAGTQLRQIQSVSGILSPSLWLAFALLGIFPLFAKYVVMAMQQRRILPTLMTTHQHEVGEKHDSQQGNEH